MMMMMMMMINIMMMMIPLERYATVSQAEMYIILACTYKIHMEVMSENYLSICSDSHSFLKALEAARTASL